MHEYTCTCTSLTHTAGECLHSVHIHYHCSCTQFVCLQKLGTNVCACKVYTCKYASDTVCYNKCAHVRCECKCTTNLFVSSEMYFRTLSLNR